MFRLTLTVTKSISHLEAGQIIDQLTDSLTIHPASGGEAMPGFQKVSQRQLQGWLRSPDDVVGFILSVARAGSWGVNLTAVPDKAQGHEFEWSHRESGSANVARDRELESLDASRAPGGVQVMMAQGNCLVDSGSVPALGMIEAGMQLLCSIERRRSVEGQEAGLMINAGSSQRTVAEHLGVSQQAVSSRLQAGYWYESRRVAYWVAQQLSELVQS